MLMLESLNGRKHLIVVSKNPAGVGLRRLPKGESAGFLDIDGSFVTKWNIINFINHLHFIIP